MRIRAELVAGAAFAAALGIGAAALGARRARVDDHDWRRSTFLTGPFGALGYAQALERLGVRVERLRRPPAELGRLFQLGDSTRTLVAVLGPSTALSVAEARTLIDAGAGTGAEAGVGADLLLAGRGTGSAMRCLGYRPETTRDTTRVRAIFAIEPVRRAVDSSMAEDGVPSVCAGPVPVAVDTLLAVPGGAAALRLAYEGGRTVTLVADDQLFSNRALRTTSAGPFALGLVVPRYGRIVVDEYHHGFGTSGSLAAALLAWSVRSPWGWALWQLAAVGTLALLAAGLRFGPVRAVIDRRRRSPLEHVRALATALAAARGHGVAVGLMVRGLRRRLSRAGQPARADPQAWLDGLAGMVRTAEGRRALETLREITSRSAGTEDVRRAANAVEDVWEELTTKSPPTPLPLMPRPPQRS